MQPGTRTSGDSQASPSSVRDSCTDVLLLECRWSQRGGVISRSDWSVVSVAQKGPGMRSAPVAGPPRPAALEDSSMEPDSPRLTSPQLPDGAADTRV